MTGDPYSAVGGIVGELSGGVVKNCAAEFTVDGGGEPLGLFAGGVAGAAEKGLLQNCRSSARMEHVRGHYLYLGGVAGCLRDSRRRTAPLPSPLPPWAARDRPSMPGTWLGASRENPPWSTASTGSGWIAPSGNWKTEATPMMTNEARVAAVTERVRARVQLRKQRRMAGVLVLAALAAGIVLGSMAHHEKEVD